MEEIEIYINPPAGATYDDRRGHLLLHHNLTFYAGLKENAASGELTPTTDAQNPNKDEINKLMVLVKNGIDRSALFYAPTRKVVNFPNKIKFPDFLVGGGLTWLEFTKNGSMPTGKLPNGCYVSALGTPEILDTYWTDSDYEEINGPVAFGSQVLLHIYTKDMYGQEVEISLTDRDIFDPDDLVFKYRREVNIEKLHPAESGKKGLDGIVIKDNERVQHVQKITLTIVVDLSWQFKAGSSLKLYPVIKSEGTSRFFKGFKRKYLTAEANGEPILDLASKGNKAVMVGKVETNIRAFDPCRYTHIELDYDKRPPVILFDQKNQINTSITTAIDIGIIGNSNEDSEKKATITVEDVYTSECTNEPELHKGVVIDIKALEKAEIKNDYSEGTTTTLSFVPKFPYQFIDGKKSDFIPFFLEYFLVPKPELLAIPVETCAYQKPLDLNIYPDVAWSYHFQYDVPEEGYFKDIAVPLIRGLDSEIDFIKPYILGEYNTYYSGNPLDRFVLDLLIEYIRDIANKLAFGIHAYHNFNEQQTKATLLDYTAEYKWIAKTVITVYLIVLVIIEALIIYITRGRGLVTKAGKIEKAIRKTNSVKNKLENKMRGNDMSFIYPAINAYRSQGYETLDNGDIAFVMQESITADPLFGVQYEKKVHLGTMVAKATGISGGFDAARSVVSILGKIMKYTRWSKNAADAFDKRKQGGSLGETYDELNKNKTTVVTPTDATELLYVLEDKVEENLKKFAANLGQDMEFTLTIAGEYKANYICKIYNVIASNKYYFNMDNKLETFINGHLENDKVAFSRKKAIEAKASFEINSKITIKTAWINTYIPEFLGVKAPDLSANSDVHGKAQIQGGIAFERVYTFIADQPVYQDIVMFSGLIGDYEYKVDVNAKKGEDDWGSKEEQENTTFVLMEPYIEEGRKIPIFSIESLKEHF